MSGSRPVPCDSPFAARARRRGPLETEEATDRLGDPPGTTGFDGSPHRKRTKSESQRRDDPRAKKVPGEWAGRVAAPGMGAVGTGRTRAGSEVFA